MKLCEPCHRILHVFTPLGAGHFDATHDVCQRCGFVVLVSECSCKQTEEAA
jgi:hypothetical protein